MIEAKLDRGRGPVATVLVQRGTLHVGDLVVAGAEWGRVRALVSDTGETDQRAPARRRRSRCSASPARRTPATASRWSRTKPAPARSPITAPARSARRSAARATGMRGSLEQMMAQAKTSGRKEFPLVIKADVQGSLEAIIGSLDKLGTDEVGGARAARRRRRHFRDPT